MCFLSHIRTAKFPEHREQRTDGLHICIRNGDALFLYKIREGEHNSLPRIKVFILLGFEAGCSNNLIA